ncbi:MAG: hypothetical protein KDA84_23180, partial [Planctomycetaceae bacterium]|nr:hypothetical protein [Planctomycetaceae bacterium]
MPLSSFRLARLWLASGLMIVTTFTSAWAQETPVDPNYKDVILPQKTEEGLQPVQQLACPENDYPNCAPAPASWHPPILFPGPETSCPTGVVHRDWLREHTTGHSLNHRQRMLEKDYAWRVENAHQPTCCPPPSNWGHKTDECKSQRSWWRLCGGESEACGSKACGNGCGATSKSNGCADQHGCADQIIRVCPDQTSAVSNPTSQDVSLANGEGLGAIEGAAANSGPTNAGPAAPGELNLTGFGAQSEEPAGIQT